MSAVESSEKDKNCIEVGEPGSRKFYHLNSLQENSNGFPLKRSTDPIQLFKYIEDNLVGGNYSFTGPFGLRTALYCDYTASGRPLRFIEDYLNDQVLPAYGNTHTTSNVMSLQTTMYRHEARDIVRNAVNASEYDSVIFIGNGATGAVHKLIHAMNVKEPIVFVGPFEHHSNLLPWREICSMIIRIPETSKGQLNVELLEKYLEVYKECGRRLIGCFSAASNITGILTNTDQVTIILHKYGALALWDYASAAPYVKIDMNPLVIGVEAKIASKDAIFISTHKFVGGVSTPGILVAKKLLFENPIPSECGGGTIFFVTRESHRYLQDIEMREEGGTPPIVEAIRAGLVFQLKEAVTSRAILKRDGQIVSKIMEFLKNVENLEILGSCEADRLPIFSFLVRHKESGVYLHHNYVATIFNDLFGIQARAGCACAGPYALDLLGINERLAKQIDHTLAEDSRLDRVHLRRKEEHSDRECLRPGFVRVSIPYFMSDQNIDFILKSIKIVCQHAWKLLPQYILNPETGEWRHHKNMVMKDRKWLGSISYQDATLTYPKDNVTKDVGLDQNGIIEHAMQVFENAKMMSLRRELSDQSAMFDDVSTKLCSFLLPSEAKLFLNGSRPKSRLPPFQPTKYPLEYPAIDVEYLKKPKAFGSSKCGASISDAFGALLSKIKDSNWKGENSANFGDLIDTKFMEDVNLIKEMLDLQSKDGVFCATAKVGSSATSADNKDNQESRSQQKVKKKKKMKSLWRCPSKPIIRSTLKAIHKFDMIKNGDRILVCLSGGKDSLTLLHTIKQYQHIAARKNVQFEFGAITVDPQTEAYDPSSLKEYLAKLSVPYFYEQQCIIDQAAALPEQCKSICSFCSRMKRGRIYACARRECYNVIALGQHLDDLAESFLMAVFHNGRLGTMKANYTVKEGDLRVIRPFVFTREEHFRQFAINNSLPVISENCPACFEAPKERHRIKQLLASQEVLFPKLYSSLKSAMFPIMSINKTAIDARHLFYADNDDSD